MIAPRPPRSYINQRNFAFALAGIVVAGIIGYLGYEFRLLGRPSLEVLYPTEDIAINDLAIDVSGRADPNADLTLNSRPIFLSESGEFSEHVLLVKGVNRLDIIAKNRYGKTTTATRYVVVR